MGTAAIQLLSGSRKPTVGFLLFVLLTSKIIANDGREGAASILSSRAAVNLQPTLTIPDASAIPGATLDIPIVVSDATGIAGAEISVTYNSNILTALSARTTALTQEFTLVYSVSSGKIALVMANPTGIASGSGSLANLTFKVSETAKHDTTSLAFAALSLRAENLDSIPALHDNGLFTVANRLPEIVSLFSDTTLSVGGGNVVYDLNTVFYDPDEDKLSYSANNSNESIATVSLNGNILTVTPISVGVDTIIVTAEDDYGGTISDEFKVTVGTITPPQKVIVSPNPFTPNRDGFNDYVNFKFPPKSLTDSEITIFDISGKRVRNLSTQGISTIKWDGVDRSGRALEPGVYIYLIKSNGKQVANGTVTLMR